MTDTPVPVSAAEIRATAVIAIAKALIEVATDFGTGNVVAADAFVFADAAFGAAAPLVAADERAKVQHAIDRVAQTAAAAQEMAVEAERERCAELARAHGTHPRDCGLCRRQRRDWMPLDALLRRDRP